MLVLSRRVNEKLLIPCIGTAIQVLSIQGGQVRLGIQAPSEVAVFREEIYKADPESESPTADDCPAVAPVRVPGLVRNRLAQLALGLARLHRHMQGETAPRARAALTELGDDLHEFTRIMNSLLEEDGAAEAKRPTRCAP